MCLYGGNRTLLLLKTRLDFPHGASSSAADMHDCSRLNLQPVVLSDKRSTEAFWERSAHIWSVAVVNREIFILCYWTCNPISEMNYWFMLFVFPFFCKVVWFPIFLSFVYIYFFTSLFLLIVCRCELTDFSFFLIIHVWLLRCQRCNMLYFCFELTTAITDSFMPQGSRFFFW